MSLLSTSFTAGLSQKPIRSQRNSKRKRLLAAISILGALLSLTAITILATIVPLWNANFFYNQNLIKADWPDALLILPLLCIFTSHLWYVVQFCLARRDFRRSRPPGQQHGSRPRSIRVGKWQMSFAVYILVTLLGALVLAGLSGIWHYPHSKTLQTTGKLTSRGGPNTSSSSAPLAIGGPSLGSAGSPSEMCTPSNALTRSCNPTFYLISDLQITVLVLGSLVWLINLLTLILQIQQYRYQNHKAKLAQARARVKAEKLDAEHFSATETTHRIQFPNTVHVRPTLSRLDTDDSVPRPKKHFHKTGISPSRSYSNRSIEKVEQPVDQGLARFDAVTAGRPGYSQAVNEARRSMRPEMSLRSWIEHRQV